jgi:hypothetical protein
MSLFEHRPRPLQRDSLSLRDDRLFVVGCEDTYAPVQYFGFFRLSRVQVFVVGSKEGRSAANHVIERLLSYKRECEADDELWMLLDTDHYISGSHMRNFKRAIKIARQNKVKVAVSRPCFDLWLLLHHVDENVTVNLSNATDVARAIRTKLGQFNKANLKPDHYPLASVVGAYRRAERLDSTAGHEDIPPKNSTRVYKLWQAIIEKSLESQLPGPLASLKNQ